MFDDDRQPIFTAHGDPEDADSYITVDRWEPRMLLEPKVLEWTDSRFVRCEDGVVTITVANGTASYRITGWSRERQALTLRLIESTGPTDG